MPDKLVPERDLWDNYTGRMLCVSCSLWNCWHNSGEDCDVDGCQCNLGHGGGGDREPRVPVEPIPEEALAL